MGVRTKGLLVGLVLSFMGSTVATAQVVDLNENYVTKYIFVEDVKSIDVSFEKEIEADCNSVSLHLNKITLNDQATRHLIEIITVSTVSEGEIVPVMGCQDQSTTVETIRSEALNFPAKNGNAEVELIMPKGYKLVIEKRK